MMMPANYSVIAENEMTYVNGGKRPARAAWERPFLLPCFSPSDPGDAPELLMILGGFLYGSFHFTA